MKAVAAAAVMGMLVGAASAQTLDDLKNDGKNTDNVLTYGMGYQPQPLQPAQADRQGDGQAAGAGLESQSRQPWGEQAQPLVLGRRDVCDQRQGDGRDRRRHRQADLENAGRLAAGDAARRVLRRLQQGRRRSQRQGLPHHARCPCHRARHEDRQGDLEARRPPSGRKAIP